MFQELQQVPVVSANVVETPHTYSSDVESVVDCDRSYPDTVVQNSAYTADENDEVLSAEYGNDMAQITDNKSQDAVTSSVLINEQKHDETLSSCSDMARQGKGNFVISRGILYRKDKVEGQPVCQLCLPVGRRKNVLKLAHYSVYGGHMGERERETCQRIKLSFYWPGLKRSVSQYTSSCKDCQLRSRKMTTDRVPITPITRDDVPFQTLNMVVLDR